jgi:hypothetical protein
MAVHTSAVAYFDVASATVDPTPSNENHIVNTSGAVVYSPVLRRSLPVLQPFAGQGSHSFSQHREGTCSDDGGALLPIRA